MRPFKLVTSTGQITQPEYYLRVFRTNTQALTNNTITAISWDTLETVGGGNSGFTFTPNATTATTITLYVTALFINKMRQVFEIVG